MMYMLKPMKYIMSFDLEKSDVKRKFGINIK